MPTPNLFGTFSPAPSAVPPGGDSEPDIDFARELGLPSNRNYTAPAPPSPQERAPEPPQAQVAVPQHGGFNPAMSPDPVDNLRSFIDLDNGVVVINGIPGPLLPEDLAHIRSEAMKAAGRAWTIAADKNAMHPETREV